MASNLLNIVYQEFQPINKEKLKFICTKHNIWDHFKLSKVQYASYSDHEKMQMLKRFYTDLVPVYYSDGKNFFVARIVCLLVMAQDKITPLLNQPEKLEEYMPQENEVKILRSIYDTITGQFLGLENCLAYLTIRCDFQEQFF